MSSHKRRGRGLTILKRVYFSLFYLSFPSPSSLVWKRASRVLRPVSGLHRSADLLSSSPWVFLLVHAPSSAFSRGGKLGSCFAPALFARSFALPSAFAWLSSSALQRGPLNLKRRKLGKPRTYSLTPGRPPPLLQREAGESAAAGWREKAEARCLLEA